MHIAVDAHNLLHDSRGIGRYVRAVLSRIISTPDIRWTLLTHTFPAWRAKRALRESIGSELFSLARSVPKDADVVWHPWNGTFFASDVPSIVTMHDAVPFAFPNLNEQARSHEQQPFLTSIRTARHIITVSRFAGDEIHRHLGFPTENISVTHLAADAAFHKRSANLPKHLTTQLRDRPYILAVGAAEPRKNIQTLYDAYVRAFPEDDVALVGTGFDAQRMPRAIVIERTRDDVFLADLYNNAHIVAFPSYYEGFGLPVLEGMACGVPVIAVRASSVAEIGGNAAYWIDAQYALDVDVWAAALKRLRGEASLRETLGKLGLEHVTRFSWDTTAARTLAILQTKT